MTHIGYANWNSQVIANALTAWMAETKDQISCATFEMSDPVRGAFCKEFDIPLDREAEMLTQGLTIAMPLESSIGDTLALEATLEYNDDPTKVITLYINIYEQ